MLLKRPYSLKRASGRLRASITQRKMASEEHNVYHRRSKSASDGFLRCTQDESLGHAKNCCDQSPTTQPLVSTRKNQGSGFLDNNLAHGTIGTSSNHRVSLKNDVNKLQLELHHGRSIHAVLEKTIGRVSTASSPGHGNFSAQIKELMVEIEMLEEEIASREQYVLSLYRSIFDQCKSTAPSSEQGSSIASPVCNIKERSKKHPTVVSSAFCSSMKLPFPSFHIWGGLMKQKIIFEPEIRQGSVSSEPDGNHLQSIASVMRKVDVWGSSNLGTNLKEDLSKCPNQLSEKMVKYMANIYCLLHWNDPSEKTEKMCTPFLSRSSTTVLPRGSSVKKDHFSFKRSFGAPSMLSERYQSAGATSAITSYRLLLKHLEKVNLGGLDQNAKCAFWLNIYNSLVMHAYLAYGFPSSSLRRVLVIHKAGYNIGGHIVTANFIDHYILRCNTIHTGRWIETLFTTAMRKKNGVQKHLTNSCYALAESEPLVLFALCSGSSSDPMLRVYTPRNISDELKKARKEYLQDNVVIRNSKRILLPKVVERYAKEASLSHEDLLELVSGSLDGKYPELVHNCKDLSRKKASQIIEWLPQNARFRYVFAKDLTINSVLR